MRLGLGSGFGLGLGLGLGLDLARGGGEEPLRDSTRALRVLRRCSGTGGMPGHSLGHSRRRAQMAAGHRSRRRAPRSQSAPAHSSRRVPVHRSARRPAPRSAHRRSRGQRATDRDPSPAREGPPARLAACSSPAREPRLAGAFAREPLPPASEPLPSAREPAEPRDSPRDSPRASPRDSPRAEPGRAPASPAAPADSCRAAPAGSAQPQPVVEPAASRPTQPTGRVAEGDVPGWGQG